MLIYFKGLFGTYLTVRSENIIAFETRCDDELGYVNVLATLSSGDIKCVASFFFDLKSPEDKKEARLFAGKHVDKLSKLLTVSVEFAVVDPDGSIILSDGRSF
jgi:hypothetical protein